MSDITSTSSESVQRYAYKDLSNALGLAGKAGKRAARSKDDKPVRSSKAAVAAGSRNTVLASVAGSLRRLGLDQDQVAQVLDRTNQVMTSDPLDDAEVEGIAKSIARYEPGNPQAILFSLTDTGNADRFTTKWHQNIRYVPEWRRWLIWDGTRWVVDGAQQIVELAKTSAREILIEAGSVADHDAQLALTKHAISSQKLERLRAMIKLAESVPELVVRAKDLDKDPMLLNVRNGTLDLRTGQLRPADQKDYITRQSPLAFDPDAKCPTFREFLSSITAGDQELVDYIQRVMGYCLTGETSEQCLFFFYGAGANGKSTLLNVIKELLGPEYSKQTPAESLMVKTKGGGASNDIARLEGARVTLSNEVEEGSRLAESMVKQLTGSDPITSRFLYAEFFEYIPQFKLIIAGNHRPVIRGADDGIWRRLQLVPFLVTFSGAKKDPKLAGKLRAELPGILNFALEGCLKWQSGGLQPPPAILDAVSEYKSEMDLLGQWVAENCVVGPEHKAQASMAYADYRSWATANGYQPLSANSFGRRLGEKYTRKKTSQSAYYLGLRTNYPESQ